MLCSILNILKYQPNSVIEFILVKLCGETFLEIIIKTNFEYLVSTIIIVPNGVKIHLIRFPSSYEHTAGIHVSAIVFVEHAGPLGNI